jgi:uncharacterized protein (TIGR00730 family)
MAKFLSDLLDAEEPIFTEAIKQLEDISGKTGADVKLIGDITAMAHDNLRTLGLNPAASTGEEVYRALLGRVGSDIKRLIGIIGAEESRSEDVRYLVPFMVEAANKVDFNRKVFVIRRERAKELLRQMPPKNLMKHLGYDDIEKMFEGEDFDEIYTALRFSEGPEWLTEYNELFKEVTPEDYEERDLRIVVMNHDKYVDLAAHLVQKKLHNVTHTKEMGIIVVVPMHARKMRGLVLKTLPLLFHYMNEVKLYSTFFKLKSAKPHFGRTVVETLIADPGTGSQMVGKRIHWRVIQRYLAKHKEDSDISKIAFEPHVHPEDLHWRRAEDLLFQLDPELEFWKDRDYVALNYDGFPVAFNLFDVSFAYSNKASYEDRYAYHFRESLWNEIFIRYMGFKNLANQILSQLDNEAIAPERLPVVKPKQPKSKVRKDKTQKNLLIRQRLIDSAEGRLSTVVDEFESVFEMLAKHEKTVTIFGSARKPQDDNITMGAYDLAARLSREGYAVITGGGAGVMEAANRGAYEAGGESIGLNILLPFEQKLNEYTTDSFQFQHFFGRKVAMTLDSSAFVYYPGGFGTFDELFEILALQQTRKIEKTPIVLVGSDFWRPFDAAIREVMLDRYQTIEYQDTELYRIYDNYDEIIEYINEEYKKDLKDKH